MAIQTVYPSFKSLKATLSSHTEAAELETFCRSDSKGKVTIRRLVTMLTLSYYPRSSPLVLPSPSNFSTSPPWISSVCCTQRYFELLASQRATVLCRNPLGTRTGIGQVGRRAAEGLQRVAQGLGLAMGLAPGAPTVLAIASRTWRKDTAPQTK
ncbi:hypothetical protein M407DRAFT_7657 [Tulasnella calospora MUT 4182]|uniref:Uncharacterized protein n=1 Tax=Tulasnella calospora MUT 4182 TaxID=1051891 RepID=A0A0C3QK94_9AGAM|nr:hypothetical protein M407DRAFT_7657 [Tulasnella calospora MUT 4182]